MPEPTDTPAAIAAVKLRDELMKACEHTQGSTAPMCYDCRAELIQQHIQAFMWRQTSSMIETLSAQVGRVAFDRGAYSMRCEVALQALRTVKHTEGDDVHVAILLLEAPLPKPEDV